jgi:hypothetical protein
MTFKLHKYVIHSLLGFTVWGVQSILYIDIRIHGKLLAPPFSYIVKGGEEGRRVGGVI